MPKKEIVKADLASANPHLSPATRFGNLVFVAGQTGRHPRTGELGKDVREQTRNILERIKVVLFDVDSFFAGSPNGKTSVTVANIMGFFIESMVNGPGGSKNVIGRLVAIPGVTNGTSNVDETASFLRTVLLVR